MHSFEITAPDRGIEIALQHKIDRKTKPLGALGLLEKTANNTAYHARQLLDKSSIIRDRVAKKKLRISSGIYHLDSGEVSGLH